MVDSEYRPSKPGGEPPYRFSWPRHHQAFSTTVTALDPRVRHEPGRALLIGIRARGPSFGDTGQCYSRSHNRGALKLEDQKRCE